MAVSLNHQTEPTEPKPLPWTRPQARWTNPRPVDVALAQRLSAELNLPPLISSLLVARGMGAVEDARKYLRPRMDQLHSPFAMRMKAR